MKHLIIALTLSFITLTQAQAADTDSQTNPQIQQLALNEVPLTQLATLMNDSDTPLNGAQLINTSRVDDVTTFQASYSY